VNLDPTLVYNDKFVMDFLSEEGIEVPLDPYLKKYDFSSLRNEAARVGFVPFNSLAEEIERVMNFQEFMTGGCRREPRTFNKWLSSSKRFWRSRVTRENKQSLAAIGYTKFTTISNLEKLVTRSFSGWIYVGQSLDGFTLVNSGPSLKVSFKKTPVSGDKMSLWGIKHSLREYSGTGVPTRLSIWDESADSFQEQKALMN